MLHQGEHKKFKDNELLIRNLLRDPRALPVECRVSSTLISKVAVFVYYEIRLISPTFLGHSEAE
jgi:hypothetical protein